MTFSTRLTDRAVIELGGGDVRSFLDRLVTSAVPEAGEACHSALLTPQGKVLFEFLLVGTDEGFLIDVCADAAEDLAKRLAFYRLRADVSIADRSGDIGVAAASDRPAVGDAVLVFADPRDPGLGWRVIGPTGDLASFPDAQDGYEAARIERAMPELGADFSSGDVFPHDIGLDQTGGVAFTKGCFVGQEVVSRMQHRGTARRRPVRVVGDTDLSSGAEITGNNAPVGTIASAMGRTGIAIARLDRAADAAQDGSTLAAGNVTVTLLRPHWASYDWPTGLSGPTEEDAA